MTPRLESSKKWTPLPTELAGQIVSALKDNFKELAKTGEFIAEGQIFPSETLMRLGYLEGGRLIQINAEVSCQYDFEKDNITKILHLCIDCAASLLASYFDNPEQEIPREWKPQKFEKRDVFIQFSTINTNLEQQADKLLGDIQSELVQGDDSKEETDAIKSMLGVDTDEDKKKPH